MKVIPEQEHREDCRPRRVLELFTNKWTTMVLHILYQKPGYCERTGALLRSMPGISKKMLTQTLREMEGSGLVKRRVHGTVPPAVDYTLTPLGKRFVEPVELLYGWADKNSDALDDLTPRPRSRRRSSGSSGKQAASKG